MRTKSGADAQAYRNLASEVFRLAIADYLAVQELIQRHTSNEKRMEWINQEAARLAKHKYPKRTSTQYTEIAAFTFDGHFVRAKTIERDLADFLSTDSQWSVILGLDMKLFWSKIQKLTIKNYALKVVPITLAATQAMDVY